VNPVEERVAFLEGRIEEHAVTINGIREAIASLEARMDRRFEAIDRRFEQIEQRFAGIDQRFIGLDLRLDGLDAKISRQFVWLVGIMLTMLIAVIGGLGGVIAAILR
jgi:uncharacterized coiled-coil protein SlyX